MLIRIKNGQSTLEYALVISVIVGALLAVNTYVKRGVKGRLKESTDRIGSQFDAEKEYKKSWKSVSGGTTTTTEERDVTSGGLTTVITSDETTTSDEKEVWGTAEAALPADTR